MRVEHIIAINKYRKTLFLTHTSIRSIHKIKT
ncbi:hypothetical protein CY0110_19797 [Crocosphaera chwakensis CCY0110]|uniref:Uncharacterized protein n=1 Tax=Crocosphaera chwakensis CCY0110 TaxID=391612 RepID=A3IJU1_9CHRO|nr:hypothetical protein CY0110_19797 [Crocosphaera chwakensis CCY0110]